MIYDLEKMDSVASLGMRGRTLGEEELLATYQATVLALGDFVDGVTEAERTISASS
jgi:hypothetical protein